MGAQCAGRGEIRTGDVRVALYLLAPYYELIDVEGCEEIRGSIIFVFALPPCDRSVPDSHDHANR